MIDSFFILLSLSSNRLRFLNSYNVCVKIIWNDWNNYATSRKVEQMGVRLWKKFYFSIYMNRLLSKIVNHQNYGFREEPFLKGFKWVFRNFNFSSTISALSPEIIKDHQIKVGHLVKIKFLSLLCKKSFHLKQKWKYQKRNTKTKKTAVLSCTFLMKLIELENICKNNFSVTENAWKNLSNNNLNLFSKYILSFKGGNGI